MILMNQKAMMIQSAWRSFSELVQLSELVQVAEELPTFHNDMTNDSMKDHGATSNPKTPVGGAKQDLVDTPEHAPAASGKKKLRQGKSNNVKKIKTKEIVFDSVVWTKEELNEEEYGIARLRLKQHGLEKSHVENMHKVMSDDYPALRDVMKILLTTEPTAEEVVDTISGVPTRRSSLEEKLRDLVGPPEFFPDECQYILLGKDQATCQSAKIIERSERLYHKKMSDSGEKDEMMLIECGIHAQTEVKMLMKMSKSGAATFDINTVESLLY